MIIGILQRTADAKERTGKAEVIENAKLDVLAQMSENNGENISKDQLKTILNKYFKDINTLELPNDLSETNILLTANIEYGGYENIKLSEIYNGNFTNQANTVLAKDKLVVKPSADNDYEKSPYVNYIDANGNTILYLYWTWVDE